VQPIYALYIIQTSRKDGATTSLPVHVLDATSLSDPVITSKAAAITVPINFKPPEANPVIPLPPKLPDFLQAGLSATVVQAINQ